MPHDDGRIYIRRTDHRRAPSRDGRNWEEDDRRDDDDDRRETVVIRRRDEEDERREKVAVARRREDERREKRPGAGGPIKRLVVACDGTWLDSDNGMLNGDIPIPSNVTRLSRAIRSESADGIQQVVSYQAGIGTSGSILNRIAVGATGDGIESDVREGYSFICNNWAPGDEVFLIGFSRGAFTARSIAGLISTVGVLTKRGLRDLVEIYRDVRHRADRRYRPRNPDRPFPNKPSVSDPRYRYELERRGLTTLDVTVKAIGVWDTVGSLGAPRVPVLTRLGLQSEESKEMRFHDTKLSNIVENAFQALALDERRSSFSPAVWEKPRGNTTTLRQVWFPGVHSSVGGGLDDLNLSNITLAWMMAQLEPFLDMDTDFVLREEDENIRWYKKNRLRIRPWSFGHFPESMKGVYSIAGGTTRTPGRYYATDPDTSEETDRPLRETCEYIHPSVRTRIRLRGPGRDDRGPYDPESLDDWKLHIDYPPDDPEGRFSKPHIVWKARFREDAVSTRVIPEAPLWGVEKRLLALDPETEDYVYRPPPSRR